MDKTIHFSTGAADDLQKVTAIAREIDLAVREIAAGMYRRTLELLHARQTLLRGSAAELLIRETHGDSGLGRIRAVASAPVLPLPKAA